MKLGGREEGKREKEGGVYRTLELVPRGVSSLESAAAIVTAFISALRPSTPFWSALAPPPIELVAVEVTFAAFDPYRNRSDQIRWGEVRRGQVALGYFRIRIRIQIRSRNRRWSVHWRFVTRESVAVAGQDRTPQQFYYVLYSKSWLTIGGIISITLKEFPQWNT